MRLIDADALKVKLPNTYHNGFENCRECKLLEREEVNAYIDSIPTIDAVPVVHGRWNHCKGESNIWYCSVCGEKIIYNPTRKTYKPSKKPVGEINKYCRNCGARMDLEEQCENN